MSTSQKNGNQLVRRRVKKRTTEDLDFLEEVSLESSLIFISLLEVVRNRHTGKFFSTTMSTFEALYPTETIKIDF